MRRKLILALLCSLFGLSLLGDEKDNRTTPEGQSNTTVTSGHKDPVPDLIAAVKRLEDRVSALEDAMRQQKRFPNFLPGLTPLDSGAQTIPQDRGLPSRNPDPLINPPPHAEQPSAPIPARPGFRERSAEPDARKPDGPYPPRLARESKTWQRFKVDGKLFFLVPATDVEE